MRVLLDLSGVRCSGDLHDKLERAGMPTYYGRNLDALYDVLTELPETELIISGFDEMCSELGSYAEAFRAVLRDAEKANVRLRIVIR